MDVTIVLIIAAVVLNLGLLVWVVLRTGRLEPQDNSLQFDSAIQLLKAELVSRQSQALLDLRGSIDSANRIINERLAEGAGALDKRLSVFGKIETKLGQLSEQAANIESVGRNIQSLSDLLRPPKSRGKLGELLLENLLAQIFPRALFETQYRFADGLRVDAVIRLGDRLLPIDAKFPLEAYERLVASPDDKSCRRDFNQTFKKHVDAISSRYVKPDQKTTDFAILYVPAEAVYYQLISQEDSSAFEYALEKKVVPSSPGHLYGFLASLAAIYSEISLAQDSLDRGSRWLVTGINGLKETSDRLDKLHRRMEGSLRSLNAGFEKARLELNQIHLQLEKLREPVASVSETADSSSDVKAADSR